MVLKTLFLSSDRTLRSVLTLNEMTESGLQTDTIVR